MQQHRSRSVFVLLASVATWVLASAGVAAQDARPVEASSKRGPRVLDPAECGIGEAVPRLAWRDLDGRPGRLGEAGALGGQVVVLTDTACPLAQKYAPTVARLAKRCRQDDLDFVLLNTVEGEEPAEMRRWLAEHEIEATYVHDPSGELARALGARTTTDVFLLDRRGRRVYRGAIDDRFGLGYALDAPRERYLDEAIEALFDGDAAPVPATWAPGCVLDLEPTTAAGELSWNGRAGAIIERRCAACHHEGGVAPFELTTREAVERRKGMVRFVVEERLMPPWGATEEGGPWRNDHSLSPAERDDLLAWLADGLPAGEGDAARELRAPRAESEWLIGEPDVVIEIPEDRHIPAEGVLDYVEVVVPTNFDEDRWVRAVEIRPTAPQAVHHVLVHVLDGRPHDESDRRLPGFLAAYVPGNSEHVLPPGFAKKLKAGSRLFFQLHYTPNGAATSDRTRLGLVFADGPPEHEVRCVGIANKRFEIPPGAAMHDVSSEFEVPREVALLSLMPHMHLRGRAFLFESERPGEPLETLLEVPDYDFNWQFAYRFEEPVVLPRGSRITVTGWFDNSEDNPANPDPAQAVHWGDQTFDEMMIGYVEYYLR